MRTPDRVTPRNSVNGVNHAPAARNLDLRSAGGDGSAHHPRVALVPTLEGLSRNSRTEAAKDTIYSRLHEARSYAIDELRPYRVWVNPEGTRIRLGPAEVDSGGVPLDDPDVPAHTVEVALPEEVLFKPNADAGQSAQPDSTNWIPIVTFMRDGSCREAEAEFIILEPGVSPVYVYIRGLTGGVEFGQGGSRR